MAFILGFKKRCKYVDLVSTCVIAFFQSELCLIFILSIITGQFVAICVL